MSLYTDIQQARVSVSGSFDKGVEAEFNFAGTLALFQGHFPGNPILPGIAQIEMVRSALEAVLDKKLTVRSVKKTKFSHLIEPDTPVFVKIDILSSGREPEDRDLFTVRAAVRTQGTAAGKVNLSLAVSEDDLSFRPAFP